MKKIILFLLIVIPFNVYADNLINEKTKILINNNVEEKIIDDDENTFVTIKKDVNIEINSEDDIYGIYILYELKGIKGIISSDKKEETIGNNGFLHEYINVKELIGISKNITLKYDDDVKIAEIYVLGKGKNPEWVEVWDTPLEEADLMLLTTHSDDEQLFFAGLMPYYVNKNAKIQVVYFANHNNNPKRLHEQIHGLYTVGIRNYPIIGFVPDQYSENLNDALRFLKNAGYKEDDAIKFVAEQIRRFKPSVIVGHDELGEYGHGQHILCTDVLKKAITLANDESYDNDSLSKYGKWDTPKTYLHLYKENKIVMNYDEPLDSFNGKTAYEVSKEGYSKHKTQQYTWFTKWLTGVNSKGVGTPFTKATEIKTYSPLEYGLYRTTVGLDKEKNDMFENIVFKADQKKVIKKEENSTNEEIKEENKEEKTDKENKLIKFILNIIKEYLPVIITSIVLLILIIKKK